ncbi:unnamed protein product [Caenorhabditis brenneri]
MRIRVPLVFFVFLAINFFAGNVDAQWPENRHLESKKIFESFKKTLETKNSDLINSWLSDDCHIKFCQKTPMKETTLCSMVIVDLTVRRNFKITLDDIVELNDKIIFRVIMEFKHKGEGPPDHTIDLTYDRKSNKFNFLWFPDFKCDTP